MTGFQQVAVIVAMTGLLTTLVLPGRKTADVIRAGSTLVNGALKTSQGRG